VLVVCLSYIVYTSRAFAEEEKMPFIECFFLFFYIFKSKLYKEKFAVCDVSAKCIVWLCLAWLVVGTAGRGG
jgi:hypothetical protein